MSAQKKNDNSHSYYTYYCGYMLLGKNFKMNYFKMSMYIVYI